MQNSPPNNSDLPTELCVKPLTLIGVSGLDTINNAIHKLIWENFSSNRRAERAPVLFKLISNAHEFPIIKPKRNSYDWYIPKGILKKNWVNKHLYEIPAVIVVFYDLDWNDPLWNEKMIECASRVQSMRAALEGRSTKLVVVLIQNSAPLPGGEDILAADRAATLCASCDLTSNSLYVLPLGDHLQGYVVRLENAFYEFAQHYYHGEIKVIRSHREHLNKNAHQFLFVRHQFKMGFIYELKQDSGNAHKHYTHAYNNLLEIRVVDTNALEIRTIAGFINYKLCRLMFLLNLPRDAITQFKAHVERFKNRMGFVELSFEHYAWLSKQFAVFGDIFDEAVKQGLPAVQTQHPGIYYQQGAQYAILRKKSCQELCSNVIAYPQPDPLEGVVEFYGQRPWRPGKLSGEPPDPKLESSGIQALQFLEKQVNHSSIIISLYGLAIAQYKTYRCPRTRRHLVLQMADEYYNSNDYGKALTLLTHMLWDFRAEGWWTILSEILEKALLCAFLTANIQDYVILAFEILGKSTRISQESKKLIHQNINRILHRQIPFGHTNLNPDVLQNALIQWQPILKSDQLALTLDMSNILACIETKARFMKNKYEVDKKVAVEIYVKYTCPFPLEFSRIAVTINSSTHSSEFAVDNTNLLQFNNDEIKRFVIEFAPQTSDIMKEIQIGSINLTLSAGANASIELKFNGSATPLNQELTHLKYSKEKIDFENIAPLPMTAIVPRQSKLDVRLEHSLPALLEEWYRIEIFIENQEDFGIEDLRVEIVYFDVEGLVSTDFASDFEKPSQKLPIVLNATKTLRKNDECKTEFFLRAHIIGDRNLTCKISYILNENQPVIKYENISVQVVRPFEISVKFYSTLMMEVSKFYVGEEVGLIPTLRCLSPIPIVIESSRLELSGPFKQTTGHVGNFLSMMKLREGEIGAEFFLAVCEKSSEQNVSVGRYLVTWRREGGVCSTTSQIEVEGFHCEWVPLQLKITVPAHGLVRTPLLISYHLHNRSQQLMQLDVAMEASEAFMYAGYKQYSISILPESTKTINYNLYPLIAGSVTLPKLVLSVPENSTEGPALRQDQLKFLVDRCLPTHLYVMPQTKGNPKLPDIVKPRKLQST